MKTKKQFILDTLLPYKNNPQLCAFKYNTILDQYSCVYLTDDGKKCAVGKHLIEGEHQNFLGTVGELLMTYQEEDIFTPEALEQNLSIPVWTLMQRYHDVIGNDTGRGVQLDIIEINHLVADLELALNEKFEELYY